MSKLTSCLLTVCLFTCAYFYLTASSSPSLKYSDRKKLHGPRLFSSNEIGKIASLYNESYFNEALSHILVPRVVGSTGHQNVRKYIINELRSLGWDVEEDRFTARTPVFGNLAFSNIIASFNPSASRFLVLACHYDSKYLVPRFDAATDSAVPCTIMLQIARSLHHILASIDNSDLSLKLIFFDGEEAFEEWNAEDSLYGSRNLAKRWSGTPFERAGNSASVLDSIDVLVLLDLLGAQNPKFYSFFPETQRWHYHLSSIEKKLKSKGHIPANQPLHFIEKSTHSTIEDDHVPFMLRGVPILHVIPLPFPRVWHTPDDNYSILHYPTIATLNKIFQVFTLSYLDGNIPNSGSSPGLLSTLLVLTTLGLVVWRIRRR